MPHDDNSTVISPVVYEALCRLSSHAPDSADVVSISIHVPLHGLRGLVNLTAREREVLRLASHGFATADIASKLGLTKQSVYNLEHRLYKKLGVHNRTEAVALALRYGLID